MKKDITIFVLYSLHKVENTNSSTHTIILIIIRIRKKIRIEKNVCLTFEVNFLFKDIFLQLKNNDIGGYWIYMENKKEVKKS